MSSLFPSPMCNKLLQRRGIVAYLTYCSIKSRLHCLWRPLESTLKRSCLLVHMKRGQTIMTVDGCQHLNAALWVKGLSLWALQKIPPLRMGQNLLYFNVSFP
jgi:hypothetical protein